MKKINSLLVAILMVGFFACGSDDGGETPGGGNTETITIPTSGFTSPSSYAGMTLLWEDNFEASSLNTANWTHETGTGSNGWGNNELQYYRSENTSFQDGHLIITAKQESFGGRDYTSSRIISKNKFDFRYGRVDIRAALPEGQGMWPALWMLGTNIDQVGWPACGEIDIMEKVGGTGKENEIHGTVHWQNAGNPANFGRSTNLSTNTTNQFHVYSIEWTSTAIRWMVDGVEYNVVDTTPAELDEFRRSFFFIMNVAVGGNWPGDPSASTSFPQHMIVDYFRVFQAD
ncbi:MAG: hypothetical protein Roseis2KO_29520 [Roseivirga sp.]